MKKEYAAFIRNCICFCITGVQAEVEKVRQATKQLHRKFVCLEGRKNGERGKAE